MTREQLAKEIIEAGHFLYGRGWSPATSVNATVLSRLTPGDRVVFEDYELQKAFSGVETHESRYSLRQIEA